MHDEIRKFSLEGSLGEPNIVSTKERLVEYVETMMRDYFYVPALDLEPQFTLNYSPEDEGFLFELSIYGVKVSEGDEWSVDGIMSGKKIDKYIPQTKLGQ
jgi:hypothetical protein